MDSTNRNNYSLEEVYKISHLQGFISTFSLQQSMKKSFEKVKKSTNDVCVMISPGKFLLNQSNPWSTVPNASNEDDDYSVNHQLIHNIINLIVWFKDILPDESTLSCYLFSNSLTKISLKKSKADIREEILSKVTYQPMCNFKPTFSELFNELCHKEEIVEPKKYLRIVMLTKACDKSIKAEEIKKMMNVFTSSHLDFEGVSTNYVFCERDNDFVNRTMKENEFSSLTDSLTVANNIESQIQFLVDVYQNKEKAFVELDNAIVDFTTEVLQNKLANFALQYDTQSQSMSSLHMAVEKDLEIILKPETKQSQKEVIKAKMNDYVITVNLVQKLGSELKDFCNKKMTDEIKKEIDTISVRCDSLREKVATLNNNIHLEKMTCSYWTAKIEHLNMYLNEVDITIQRIEQLPQLIDLFEKKINENVNKIISSNAFAN